METRPPLEATNLRVVLFAYAAAAACTGLLAATTPGPIVNLIKHSANGTLSVIFVSAFGLIAWALIAIGLATIPNLVDRRRAFGWFVAAHFIVLVILLSERLAVWPAGIADGITAAWAIGTFVLFYAWATAFGDPSWWSPKATGLLTSTSLSGADQMRAHYEGQIRLAAAQEERNRLARDLHDSIKQQLFAIQTAAATADTRLTDDVAGARHAIENVRASTREAMAEMEAMTDQLRAAPLAMTGLAAALRRQCEALRFRTGADVELTIGTLPRDQDLSPGTPDALLRATQEALSNVARHARATRVDVALAAQAGHLVLIVRDNGAGYHASSATAGVGVANMRSRAEDLGGHFAIGSGPDGGTSVRLAVPYHDVSTQAYVKKLRAAAIGLAIIVLVLGVVHSRSGWSMWPLVIIPTFEVLRYVSAWLRARRLLRQTA